MRGIDSGGTGNFCGSVASGSAASKPSGGIRSLHSLSACGLPTPIVALACIGNVDIQVLSCADGAPYFLRRLQAGGGVHPRSITSRAAVSKPSGGIRSLLSLSVCGLPTPVVALACIGNVDIQVLSGAGCQLYFIRRLQVFASLFKGGCCRKNIFVQLLVQPCRNRPAEFARCTRCPPGACQRRLLPLPVSVMLIFRCFLVQAGDFYFYGVCKFVNRLPFRGAGKP